MFQIPTLYTNYQELLLDLDIYGKILSESAINKDELRTLLFEEYKITHPLPTLEDKRYELSDLVSSNYHITYANEIELAENEQLVDLGVTIEVEDDFELEGNIVVPDALHERSTYGTVTDRVRSELIKEFLSEDVEELEEEVARGTEESFGTVENHAVVFEDSDEDEDAYDLDDEDSEEDSYDSDEDEEYSSDDDDDEDDSEDDYSEDEDEEDDEDDDYSSDDDYSFDDEEDSEDEEDDEEDSEDDYSEDEEDDEDDYSSEEDVNDSLDDDEEVDLSDSFESVEESVPLVPTPIEVLNKNKPNNSVEVVQPKTQVNREDEPRDLREFVRKHPRCEVSFALNYFSRKEIEKYLMMGKIIKKGTKLHI